METFGQNSSSLTLVADVTDGAVLDGDLASSVTPIDRKCRSLESLTGSGELLDRDGGVELVQRPGLGRDGRPAATARGRGDVARGDVVLSGRGEQEAGLPRGGRVELVDHRVGQLEEDLERVVVLRGNQAP